MATTYERHNFDGTVSDVTVEDNDDGNPVLTWEVLSLFMLANGYSVPEPEKLPRDDVQDAGTGAAS